MPKALANAKERIVLRCDGRPMNRREHWQTVYQTKASDCVSWFQARPTVSLAMLASAGFQRDTCIIDIGGGDSRLVDHLVAQGASCVTVLDVSGAALERARTRLGPHAGSVSWIESDVTSEWAVPTVDIWHDRAVFHFLTEPSDRAAYRNRLEQGLRLGGSLIIATFGPDGPQKCSGLPTIRYSPESINQELGSRFRLEESTRELHQTPFGTIQEFWYSRFRLT